MYVQMSLYVRMCILIFWIVEKGNQLPPYRWVRITAFILVLMSLLSWYPRPTNGKNLTILLLVLRLTVNCFFIDTCLIVYEP